MMLVPAAEPHGYLCIVLHGHLPYVMNHGTWPHGTDWLWEATAECYLPLLETFDELIAEGLSPKVTLGLTPVLVEQMASPAFREGFLDYVRHKRESAQENLEEFRRRGDPRLARLAEDWIRFYEHSEAAFAARDHDLVSAFRRLQDQGHIEIVTSGATHPYLPLIGLDECIQAQVKVGVRSYEAHFGRKPRGFWLPECGYRPRYAWAPPVGAGPQEPVLRKGVEEFLTEEGIDYFFVDAHLLEGGEALGVYHERFEALARLWEHFAAQYTTPERLEGNPPYQAYLVNSSGEPKRPAAFFARDPRTGLQVWSAEWGYPGDGWYLDFHKKHYPGGHRYWRITAAEADLGAKEIYEPDRVPGRLRENAAHFVGIARDLVREHSREAGVPAVVCAPYDTELFGHWWFEGPRWLGEVVRQLARVKEVRLATCSEYLDAVPPARLFNLPEGSWGEGGFHWIWLNDWTEWTWKRLYACEQRALSLVRQATGSNSAPLQRVLKQLLRELLLLESSDWQFLITTWSARDYAEARFDEHLESFVALADVADHLLRGRSLDAGQEERLRLYEERDPLFAQVEPGWYAALDFPPATAG